MEFLVPFVKVIHIIISIAIILLILLQPSKSGDLGSMFGGGSSESVFGSSGAVPFLVKLTRLFAVVFVATSLFLGYFSVKSISSSVVTDDVPEIEQNIDPDDPFAEQEIEEVPAESTELPESSGDKADEGGIEMEVLTEPQTPDSKE